MTGNWYSIGVCSTFIVLLSFWEHFLKDEYWFIFIDLVNSIAGRATRVLPRLLLLQVLWRNVLWKLSYKYCWFRQCYHSIMKKTGYDKDFAAVEAAASAGGQIMPPIMGAAFLMAEMTEACATIALACIPAILYFSGILAVHFEAKEAWFERASQGIHSNFLKLLQRLPADSMLVLILTMSYGFTALQPVSPFWRYHCKRFQKKPGFPPRFCGCSGNRC